MPQTTIELKIRTLPDGSRYADVRLTSDQSAAPIILADHRPVVFDAETLRAALNAPDTYGRLLFKQFFADQQLRNAWINAYAYAASGDLQLRLNLDAADPTLHDLRWETLHDPEKGQPIALHERVLLARTLDSPDRTPVVIPLRPALRALVIVSNPSDLERFNLAEIDVDGEVGRARAALSDIPVTILGDHAEAAGRATLANLAAQLRDSPPIVLLIAHGTLATGEPTLWLEQDDGTAHTVAGTDFIQAIERLAVRPMLLALLSCQSGGRGYDDTLRALGPRLAVIGVPAVLGFQGNVAINTLKTLLPTLLTELRRDGWIDRSLAAARAALGAQQPWWQAVLWLRTDGRLWAERQGTTLESAMERFHAMPRDHVPPPAPLPELHRMPLIPNPHFVGRESDLRDLAVMLKGEGTNAVIGQAAAVTGMGGIGKTNLATEFAYRYGQFFAGGVYWLSLADPANIDAEIAACGHTLDLPSFADLSLAEQVARVQMAWRQPIPRLLIFDNCDDGTSDSSQAERLIQKWRPASGGCRLLITSQRARWSRSLDITVLSVGVLHRTESIGLLQHHRPDLVANDPALDRIADELGDLPLALHLAGSFLETYRDSPTFGDPVNFLSDLRDARLLDHEALKGIDVTASPTNHDLHVARTFALSYNRLNVDDPTDIQAIKLLARAALLAPGELISRELLLATLEITQDDRDSRLEAERGLLRLLSLGLLDDEEEGALRLHRLLAAFVRRFSSSEAQAAVERAVLAASEALNQLTVPTFLPAIQPHLRHVIQAVGSRQDATAARLHASWGEHLFLLGNVREARLSYERAQVLAEATLGPTHDQTLRARDRLAMLLKDLARFDEAHALSVENLACRQSLPTPNQGDIAENLHLIGDILQGRGDYEEARAHYVQALDLRAAHLGESHHLTLTTLTSLIILTRLIDPQAADNLLVRAERSEQLLLANPSEDVLAGVAMVRAMFLALLHKDMATADLLLERARNIHRHLSTTGSPDIPRELRQLLFASTPEEAEADDDLEMFLVRVFGEFHPRTALGLMVLGMIHHMGGEHAEARRLYERALQIQQHLHRGDHLELAQLIWWRGILFAQSSQRPAARTQFLQAVSMYERLLSAKHPTTCRCRQDLHKLNQQPRRKRSMPKQSRQHGKSKRSKVRRR
ncbi:MAG: tetratricopeptide repeat protein [Chloroflexales bacterium]